jgi:putative transposase
MIRESWIGEHDELSKVRQYSLGSGIACHGLCSSEARADRFTRPHAGRLIDEEWTWHPFYGSRRVVFLVNLGHDIKRRRLQKLMRAMGLVRLAPKQRLATIA